LAVRSFFEGLNRDLRLIFLSNLVGSLGDGLYAYLLPVYVRDFLGASSVDVGILYAVLTLSAALTPFIGGFLANKYDRKKIMLLSWVLWVPVPLIFSTATHWTMLFPAMILYGNFISGPALTAYIASSAGKDWMNTTFTLISSAWWTGFIFSPTIGGYLAKIVSMRVVFYLAFVCYLVATLILMFIKSQRVGKLNAQQPESHFEDEKLRKHRVLIFWIILFAMIMFFNVLVRPFIPTFLKDVYGLDSFLIGILGSSTFAGSAFLGILIGRVGDKRGRELAVAICLGLTTISLTLLESTGSFLLLVFIFFMTGTTYTPWALMNATVSSLSPENLRVRWAATSQTVSMLAAFLAPYIGGVLYENSPNAPITITIVASAVLFAIIMLVPKITSKYREKSL